MLYALIIHVPVCPSPFSSLVAVVDAPTRLRDTAIEIRLVDGCRVRIRAGYDRALLADVFRSSTPHPSRPASFFPSEIADKRLSYLEAKLPHSAACADTGLVAEFDGVTHDEFLPSIP